ncbi:MAG: methyltransferase domain-containing protein [Actinomycetota bacterium]
MCGSIDFEPVLSLDSLPVAINAQTTAEEATSVPVGDMELVVCTDCSHLYNAAFDPALSEYDASYENSLHFSNHFQTHARALADRLITDHGLAGATVAEAGSGPGHFLAMLCEAGVGAAYGFDPSYDPDRLGAPEHAAVTLSSELFPTDGSLAPKLAFSQHVLEHLMAPVELLATLRDAVATTEGGAVYSEVPNGEVMIDRCALWDLIYEHYSYFTPVSLRLAAARAGLTAERTLTAFDDQFLSLESAPTASSDELPDRAVVGELVERAVAFGELARKRIEGARTELDAYAARGPVALWGAGSKGMTYLNLVASDGGIDAIVDVNPRKAGYGVPGVAGTITGPEALTEVQPTTVLIANPVYADEIRQSLAGLGVEAEVTALWD